MARWSLRTPARSFDVTPTHPSLGRRVRYRADGLVPQLPVAFLVAVVVEVGLRVTTLPRLASRLGIQVADDAGHTPGTDAIALPRWTRRRVRAAERVLARWPFGNTCLRQCLVTGQRLRRLDPVLRIGVRVEDDGSLLAHSWLEVDGVSIDPSAGTFLAFEGH